MLLIANFYTVYAHCGVNSTFLTDRWNHCNVYKVLRKWLWKKARHRCQRDRYAVSKNRPMRRTDKYHKKPQTKQTDFYQRGQNIQPVPLHHSKSKNNYKLWMSSILSVLALGCSFKFDGNSKVCKCKPDGYDIHNGQKWMSKIELSIAESYLPTNR